MLRSKPTLLMCTLGIMLLVAIPAQGALIQIDLSSNSDAIESGWTLVTGGNRLDNGSGVDLGGGVTAGATGWGTWSGSDRGDPAPNGDRLPPANRDLLRDFGSANNTTSAFEIRGLAAGDYLLTLYTGDPQYPQETSDSIMVNGVRVQLPDWPADWDNAVLSDWAVTIQITLTEGQAIVLAKPINSTGDGMSEYAKLAGLTVDPVAVPEPATLGLLAAGGIGLVGGAIRRRRRA